MDSMSSDESNMEESQESSSSNRTLATLLLAKNAEIARLQTGNERLQDKLEQAEKKLELILEIVLGQKQSGSVQQDDRKLVPGGGGASFHVSDLQDELPREGQAEEKLTLIQEIVLGDKNSGGAQQGDPHDETVDVVDVKGGQLRDSKAQAQAAAAANLTIDQYLPPDLIVLFLNFLKFNETRPFFECGSGAAWDIIRDKYNSSIEVLAPSVSISITDLLDLKNVHTLDLGTNCSDAILGDLRHAAVLPQLLHLSMVGSTNVSDQGLALLVQNPVRCETLQSLDITFCIRPTFEGTFPLREGLQSLVVLRRQPKCLDGQIHWNDGRTYYSWPDGTNALYAPDGSIEWCGYARYLYEDGSENRLVYKGQMVFDRNHSWQLEPELIRRASRIGVRFLRLSDTQSILEYNTKRGLFPVDASFPRRHHANLIPLGHHLYLNRQGQPCHVNDPNTYARVSHHQGGPLDEALMPPQEVLDVCRTHIEGAETVLAGRQQEQVERDAHAL